LCSMTEDGRKDPSAARQEQSREYQAGYHLLQHSESSEINMIHSIEEGTEKKSEPGREAQRRKNTALYHPSKDQFLRRCGCKDGKSIGQLCRQHRARQILHGEVVQGQIVRCFADDLVGDPEQIQIIDFQAAAITQR